VSTADEESVGDGTCLRLNLPSVSIDNYTTGRSTVRRLLARTADVGPRILLPRILLTFSLLLIANDGWMEGGS